MSYNCSTEYIYINNFCKDLHEGENDETGPSGELYTEYMSVLIYGGPLDISLKLGPNRTNLGIYCHYEKIVGGESKSKIGRLLKDFRSDEEKDEFMDWPTDPNGFMEYLTDTIPLKDDNDQLVAELVSGKGLIWFTDCYGKKWYLEE